LKLWQVDKLAANSYWFTKVKELTDCHDDNFTKLCLSPTGEYLTSLS